MYLSAEEQEGYVSLRTISKRLDISFAFLGKIFQILNAVGLSTSQRGPSGGVALARDPATITLYEVVVALDGEDLFRECVLGLPGCGERQPCPMHREWAQQRDQLELLFRRATLAETARETREQNYRLTTLTNEDAPE